MTISELSQVIVAIMLCGIASYTDLKEGVIPNWLTFGGLGAAMCLGIVGGPTGALAALGAAILLAAVPFVLFKLNGMGGGDVKLFAAVGALLGPHVGLEAQFYAFIVGAAIGLILWVKDGVFKRRLTGLLPGHTAGRTQIRFAPAIGVGVLLAIAIQAGRG